MKEINLISLIHGYKYLPPLLRANYLQRYMVTIKPEELIDLDKFVQNIQTVSQDMDLCDRFFVGYTIPQISKEFDLLRFGTEYIVNIELKSENVGVKILKQLIRNNYYLTFLSPKVYCFTYVSSENQLYILDENQNLQKATALELCRLLKKQTILEVSDIDHLFNPTNYLVSPFNSTEKFMASKYFLTAHQESIKSKCFKEIDRKGTSFISICGKAGTGKTLLTFDIAKECLNRQNRVLIIHCGILNGGHQQLKDEYNWDLIAIKDYAKSQLEDYFLIIIDECQRIRPFQLKIIIDRIKSFSSNCIFSFDKQQCLRNEESKNNIAKIILEETSSMLFELTDKIRTNKEIASFIIALFDQEKDHENLNNGNVELSYFQTAVQAKKYANCLKEYGWKIINYTPSRDILPYDEYNLRNEDSTHQVIGQEFDKVIAIMDTSYCYSDKKLAVKLNKSPYYHPVKMLFQIMTRTRLKLHVIIINNPEILERCISILDKR